MIRIPQAQGKVFGVVGLGKSGRATVASLLASGAQVIAWDDGEAGRASAQKEFPAITIKPVAEWDFSTLTSLVMSPGIFLTHPAVMAAEKAGLEVIGDIELLYRAQPNAKYVCITGTNGKSTTTTLIAHILKACGKRVEVGGNLGTPALALAPLCHPEQREGSGDAHSTRSFACAQDDDSYYVLELSSYQLDLVRTTKFDVAVLLNISPDHLDHHGSMENYIAAKMHIFDRMTAENVAIVGVDDVYTETIYRSMMASDGRSIADDPEASPEEMHRRIMEISKKPGIISISANRKDTTIYTFRSWTGRTKLRSPLGHGTTKGDISAIKSLQGAHNHQNAAAAYAACVACGCAHEEVIRAMQTYPGLAHRMEWLGEIDGVQYVNDSKATNADAAEKALLTYDNVYWIIGGVAKEGGIAPLEKYFGKIRHAYLIGEAAAEFAKTLAGKVNFTPCGTLEKAFAAATEDARREGVKGAAVLLSPACASFDQYPNFEVRGAAFVKLFEALKAGGTHGTSAA